MKTRRNPDCSAQLRELSYQLEALAYILSLTGSTGDPALERIHWGLGLLLSKMGRRTSRVARDIERIELNQMKKDE